MKKTKKAICISNQTEKEYFFSFIAIATKQPICFHSLQRSAFVNVAIIIFFFDVVQLDRINYFFLLFLTHQMYFHKPMNDSGFLRGNALPKASYATRGMDA